MEAVSLSLILNYLKKVGVPKIILDNINKNEYSELFVKRITVSNVMSRERKRINKTGNVTNQTHIDVTGSSKSFFITDSEEAMYKTGEDVRKTIYLKLISNNICDLKKNEGIAEEKLEDGSIMRFRNTYEPENNDRFEYQTSDAIVKLGHGSNPQVQINSPKDNAFQELRKLTFEKDVLCFLKNRHCIDEYLVIVIPENIISSENVTVVGNNVYSLDGCAPSTNLMGSLEMHNQSIATGKNIIYYGAPGTGKSYGVSQEIEQVYPNFKDENSEDAKFVFRTTFHPEYTYTDFVGQVMPQVKDGVVKYEFSPGIFTKALAKAMNPKQEGRPVFLVLEELSRANVAAVFGDLFQLLDRHNGRSEYSITNSLIAKEVYGDSGVDSKIYIPNNLHIYGTVNTNDQNVFVMDTAFKRRFEWKYVSTRPVSDENNPLIKIKGLEGNDSDVDWHKFYQRLNKFITTDMALGEDKQVGQFFIKFTDNDEENRNQLQNKLLQYLWDDVQGASFNGVKLFDPSISTFSELYDKFGQNQKVFSDDFLKKLFPYKRTVEEVSSDEV